MTAGKLSLLPEHQCILHEMRGSVGSLETIKCEVSYNIERLLNPPREIRSSACRGYSAASMPREPFPDVSPLVSSFIETILGSLSVWHFKN